MKNIKTFEGFKEFISRFYRKNSDIQNDPYPRATAVSKPEMLLSDLKRKAEKVKFKNKINSELPDILSILDDENLYTQYEIRDNSLVVVTIHNIFAQVESPADSVWYRNNLEYRRSEYGELISEVIERIEDSLKMKLDDFSQNHLASNHHVYVERFGNDFIYKMDHRILCVDITFGKFYIRGNPRVYLSFIPKPLPSDQDAP